MHLEMKPRAMYKKIFALVYYFPLKSSLLLLNHIHCSTVPEVHTLVNCT